MVYSNTLDSKAIAQLAVNHGFPTNDKQNLVICVAIAKAESGGNTKAVNAANTNGTVDRGLWQINSVHDAKLPGQDRFNPDVNAELMMQISSGGKNWQPWSTFNNGAYSKYTAEVASALGAADFKPDGNVLQTADNLLPGSGAVTSVVKFFELLTDINTWIRVGKVLLGAAFVAFGIIMLLKDSNVVKQTVKAGLTVATKGKAAPAIAAAEGAAA